MIEHLKEKHKDNHEKFDSLEFYHANFLKIQKRDMMKSFGYYKANRNGDIGKVLMFPDLEE